jgi:hypothetical protein
LVPESTRLAALRHAGGSAAPDYLGIDAPLLVAAVGAIAGAGAAVRFGPAQGGRGLSVTIYDGDDRHTEYVGDGGEFTAALERIIEVMGEGQSVDYKELTGASK